MKSNQKTLLITGGLWYIGAHAVVLFEQAGYSTIIIDNLSNSNKDILSWIRKILWYAPVFYSADIADIDTLRDIFTNNSIDAVIHFASFKAIGESCQKPFLYYRNNLSSSLALFEVMEEFNIKKLIFSSSASIYDSGNPLPWKEDGKLHATHPYGNIKISIEYTLGDLAKYKNWNVVALRYFNPIWAHPSWYIGENPQWIPNNLLPYVLDVAMGTREFLWIFWNDYPTKDWTCIRDYIDINDLVRAHLLAYQYLWDSWSRFQPINLGAGTWRSVSEIVEIVEQVTQRSIPKRILPRRDGDLSEFFADTDLAHRLLSWKSSIPITESIQTAWNYKIFSTKIMTTPLVSIVLPTYNPRKDWIIQSIESVLSQTYQNFELIILDDCSTNSTLGEISELLKSDPRIILIRNEKNMKLTRTLNHWIKSAVWKYIARIDDDDIWCSPLKLEKQVQFMEANPTYGLLGTWLRTIDEDGNILESIHVRLSDQEIRNNILKDSQFAHASVLIRSDALSDVWSYDPEWNFVEDYELWMRIGTKYKFSNLPDEFLSYRINPNGVSKKNEWKQKRMSLELTWKYKNKFPHFVSTILLKVPYVFLPKKISQAILRFLKK